MAGASAAFSDAALTAAIGVGGRPVCAYVLYGESISLSLSDSVRTFGIAARVDERRVDLQRHALREPVVDHRRDERAVGVDLGLGLDERRDLDDVVRAVTPHVRVGEAELDGPLVELLHQRRQHEDLVFLGRDVVRVGPQETLEVVDVPAGSNAERTALFTVRLGEGIDVEARQLPDARRDLLQPEAGRDRQLM